MKVVLTKHQRRGKEYKKGMRRGKSECIEFDGTHYYIRKFNTALNLYKILKITLYFSKNFSEVIAIKRVAVT